MTDTTTTTAPKTETVIERKLREALAKRAAAKLEAGSTDEAQAAMDGETEAETTPVAKPTKAKKAIVPSEITDKLLEAKEAEKLARAEKQAAIAKDREERKAKKEAEKLAKEAEKAKKSPNLSKVEKAFAKLPTLDADAQESFDLATSGLNKGQVAALALHLQHFLRAEATKASSGAKLQVGDTVTVINSADPRIIGKTAEITQTHRIRVHAKVPGFKGEFYLFTADCCALDTEETASSEEEAESTEV